MVHAMHRVTASFLLLLTMPAAGFAADHVVAARPGAVQALFDAGGVAAGDRILLGGGRHGTLSVAELRFDPPVTIEAAPGERPVFDALALQDVAGWRVRGLTVLPEGAESEAVLVRVSGRDVVLDRLFVASAERTEGWSAETWRQRARDGILVTGEQISVTNSHLRYVKHGIAAVVDGARVEGNVVEVFSGDGIRGLGDNSIYAGNTIATCVKVDKNHDDGFQSWSRDETGAAGLGTVRNVQVEDNLIRNGDHPLGCELQGIGLFDGIFEDWTIRGNVVIVDTWHGITVMGARRVRIEGNVVVDARPGRPGPPWIAVTAHKDGRRPEESVVSGNVTLPQPAGAGQFGERHPGVLWKDNRVVATPEEGLGPRK